MTQELLIKKIKHSPTLNTILMVEEVIKNADASIVTVSYIKKNLPRQVNHNRLIQILEYLEESNKIAVSIKGITWMHQHFL
jgi:hypothetical protein